ncbi:hypothetical protein [Enterococcus sp. DIV0876]|uniref:hypothetical protein n=1 Tax=Enterococcus sp. DIV0876 TaxID=2774633 RepID=UPI003D2FB5DE
MKMKVLMAIVVISMSGLFGIEGQATSLDSLTGNAIAAIHIDQGEIRWVTLNDGTVLDKDGTWYRDGKKLTASELVILAQLLVSFDESQELEKEVPIKIADVEMSQPDEPLTASEPHTTTYVEEVGLPALTMTKAEPSTTTYAEEVPLSQFPANTPEVGTTTYVEEVELPATPVAKAEPSTTTYAEEVALPQFPTNTPEVGMTTYVKEVELPATPLAKPEPSTTTYAEEVPLPQFPTNTPEVGTTTYVEEVELPATPVAKSDLSTTTYVEEIPQTQLPIIAPSFGKVIDIENIQGHELPMNTLNSNPNRSIPLRKPEGLLKSSIGSRTGNNTPNDANVKMKMGKPVDKKALAMSFLKKKPSLSQSSIDYLPKTGWEENPILSMMTCFIGGCIICGVLILYSARMTKEKKRGQD